MTRHTSHGNARPWEVAKGYTYATRQDLPLVRTRPPGEPSLFQGAMIVIGFFVLLAFVAAVLG